MTTYFLQGGVSQPAQSVANESFVLAFDLLPESVEWVGSRYQGDQRLLVRQGDLCDRDFITWAAHYDFDTVASTNMLEHVKHDAEALSNMYTLLQPEGHLLLFVPAMPALFGALDRALGHYRRYSKKGLRSLVSGAGFEICELYYVNVAGVLGCVH